MMEGIYKPSKTVIIGFIVLSLLACYSAQILIKRDILSVISSCLLFDKHNQVYYQGVIFAIVNDKTSGISAFLLNPLVNWKPPVIIFVILIGIGAGIIFIRSKIIGLERDKADCGKKIKDLEDDIRWKNRKISELQTDVQNTSAENDKFRRTLAQYRESHDAMTQQNAAIKAECEAALKKKDQEHEKITGDMKKFFANELYNAKNPPAAGPVQTDDNSI
ncbi:MAG: hypothetical protein PHC61_00235 [Chitinivibrionales bacterium]|nr:hypothetical protein [Chitinivibrionales bacterium]